MMMMVMVEENVSPSQVSPQDVDQSNDCGSETCRKRKMEMQKNMDQVQKELESVQKKLERVEKEFEIVKVEYEIEKQERRNLLNIFMNNRNQNMITKHHMPMGEHSGRLSTPNHTWNAKDLQRARIFVVRKIFQGKMISASLYPLEKDFKFVFKEFLQVKAGQLEEFEEIYHEQYLLMNRSLQKMRSKAARIVRDAIYAEKKTTKRKSLLQDTANNKAIDNVALCTSIALEKMDENNDLPGWHFDKDGNPFNADFIVLSLGKILHGVNFTLNKSSRLPLLLWDKLLAFVCHTIENTLKFPTNPELDKSLESNLHGIEKWHSHIQVVAMLKELQPDESGYYRFQRLWVRPCINE